MPMDGIRSSNQGKRQRPSRPRRTHVPPAGHSPASSRQAEAQTRSQPERQRSRSRHPKAVFGRLARPCFGRSLRTHHSLGSALGPSETRLHPVCSKTEPPIPNSVIRPNPCTPCAAPTRPRSRAGAPASSWRCTGKWLALPTSLGHPAVTCQCAAADRESRRFRLPVRTATPMKRERGCFSPSKPVGLAEPHQSSRPDLAFSKRRVPGSHSRTPATKSSTGVLSP